MDIFNSSHSVPHTALHWHNASYAEIKRDDVNHLKEGLFHYKTWDEISRYLHSQSSPHFHPQKKAPQDTIYGTDDKEILKIFINYLRFLDKKILFFHINSDIECSRFRDRKNKHYWTKDHECFLSQNESELIFRKIIKGRNPIHEFEQLLKDIIDVKKEEIPWHPFGILNTHNPEIFYTSDIRLYKFYIDQYLGEDIPAVIQFQQGKMFDEQIRSSMPPPREKGAH
jgi:hypothetical protein